MIPNYTGLHCTVDAHDGARMKYKSMLFDDNTIWIWYRRPNEPLFDARIELGYRQAGLHRDGADYEMIVPREAWAEVVDIAKRALRNAFDVLTLRVVWL